MTETRDPNAGDLPAEGRPEYELPGADTGVDPAPNPEPLDQPDSRERERRDELADRVRGGTPGPAASQEPDVLPDVEVPEGQM
jgi:hypothetical protein